MEKSDLFASPVRKTGGSQNADSPNSRYKTSFWTDTSFQTKDSPQELSPKHRRDESEDDIPLIPDIDEFQDEEYFNEVTEAPAVPSSNLNSFIQLNSDLKKYSAFTVVDNVNLAVLSKHLFKESDLKESDTEWSWDLLFTEVSSELRSEWNSNRNSRNDE